MTTYRYSVFGETMAKEDTRRDINPALLSIEDHTRTYHQAVVTASAGTTIPGQQATVVVNNALMVLAFTLNNDSAYRQFKIPSNYTGDAAFHVHWTKTSNANESGKNVRWKVSYVAFEGHAGAGLGNATPTVIEVEDTYESSETTSRYIYCTPNIAMAGIEAGYYVSMKIEAVTPVGTPMASEPGLFSLDQTFTEYINNGT